MIKQLSKGKVVQYFLADVAKGIFTSMIANYLLLFFQPGSNSTMPILLPTNKFGQFFTIMAIILMISKLFDAISDPLVAYWSDKCKNPRGRRLPFMQWSAIPYGLSAVLIYFAPFGEKSIGNAIWVAIFLIAYFIFYTLYSIPQRALIPEIFTDDKQRVSIYSLSAIFFMLTSGLMYVSNAIIGAINKYGGVSLIWSYRIVFLIFGVIGTVCLLLSAFAFKEKDYLKDTHISNTSFIKSIGIVVKNKDFMIITFADLCNYIAMAFFQAALFHYLETLLDIPKEQTIFIIIPAFICIAAFFPIVNLMVRKWGKKGPLLAASATFAILFLVIFFADKIPGPGIAKGIIVAILVAFPFVAINILPHSIVSDIIQVDTITTGVNREGIYASVKTFIEKTAYAFAWLMTSSVMTIGADPGAVAGKYGLQLTGIIAACFSFVSLIIFAFYNDKKIINYIRNRKAIGPNGEITPPKQDFTGAQLSAMMSAGLDINQMTDKDMKKWIKKNM